MKKTLRTADIARARMGLSVVRRKEDGPMTVEQAANARRVAEYIARRSGIKEPLLQLWKIMH